MQRRFETMKQGLLRNIDEIGSGAGAAGCKHAGVWEWMVRKEGQGLFATAGCGVWAGLKAPRLMGQCWGHTWSVAWNMERTPE